MNNCADRLAVAARRSRQMGIDAAKAKDVYARVIAEYRADIANAQGSIDTDHSAEPRTAFSSPGAA